KDIKQSTHREGGLEIKTESGKLGDINHIYSKIDYDQVLDINNKEINKEHGITNSEVKVRIINQLGPNVKAVLSYWVDEEGEEYRQITFIENNEILNTDNGALAQHTFVGYNRSEEFKMTIKGVTVYLNHTGVNIDINFEDPNDVKVQPVVLLDTTAETNVTVKWVNGLTGETVSTQSKYKEITQKVQTGSVITTKAHEAPENFYFVGKLTEDEDYEVNPNGSFEEPAIQ